MFEESSAMEAASPESVLSQILLKVKRLFTCRASAILFISPIGMNLEVVASEGFKERLTTGAIIEPDETPVSWIFTELEPLIVSNVYEDDRTKHLPWEELTASILWAPIFIGKEVGGVLALHHESAEAFAPSDLSILKPLTDQIAIVLRMTKLCRELERLATLDVLTQLYNNPYFRRRTDSEVERAKRYLRSISLVIIDPDDLTKFNETHGTVAGNKLLAEMGSTFQSMIRRVDIPARYGDEEFAILLPETNKEGAQVVGERLRKKIEETYFENRNGKRKAQITVSVGVATFPEDAKDAQGLIDKAFWALQKAKAAGKNCVYLAG